MRSPGQPAGTPRPARYGLRLIRACGPRLNCRAVPSGVTTRRLLRTLINTHQRQELTGFRRLPLAQCRPPPAQSVCHPVSAPHRVRRTLTRARCFLSVRTLNCAPREALRGRAGYPQFSCSLRTRTTPARRQVKSIMTECRRRSTQADPPAVKRPSSGSACCPNFPSAPRAPRTSAA